MRDIDSVIPDRIKALIEQKRKEQPMQQKQQQNPKMVQKKPSISIEKSTPFSSEPSIHSICRDVDAANRAARILR